MNKKRNQLYLGNATLTVDAYGYWFTAGGEKGSFGYYPHLKDHEGYPIFPDTQIHGDLRMSVKWLKNLGDDITDEAINKIFGLEGNEVASLLRVTDLELTDDSKRNWHTGLYQIKTRIKINDEKQTVEEHMLVDHEISYLEGKVLTAQLWLGYFKDENELKNAQNLINKAAGFLSGFGGFRSRGYGRGKIEITWGNNDKEK